LGDGLRSALREDPDVVLVGEMRDPETIAAAMTIAETGHLVFSTLHTNSASQTIDRIIDSFPADQQTQVRNSVGVNPQRSRLAKANSSIKWWSYSPLLKSYWELRQLPVTLGTEKTHLIDSIIQTSQDYGMIPLESSLASLVLVRDNQFGNRQVLRAKTRGAFAHGWMI